MNQQSTSIRKDRERMERHRTTRAGWLRAAVLGADDAIVSTASLMIGVAATDASKGSILTAGIAGLVAGAMSMAVGEYVSVSSQRDAEEADIALEKTELARNPESELKELASIYEKRGLSSELAMQVALALSERDRLAAHIHDELRLDASELTRPLQAAWVSCASFASFAAVPIGAHLLAPANYRLRPLPSHRSLAWVPSVRSEDIWEERLPCVRRFE